MRSGVTAVSHARWACLLRVRVASRAPDRVDRIIASLVPHSLEDTEREVIKTGYVMATYWHTATVRSTSQRSSLHGLPAGAFSRPSHHPGVDSRSLTDRGVRT
jgi:hypothetical protein